MCEPAATVYIVVCVGSWIIRARPNGFRNNAVGLAGSCGLYKISQWQPGDGSSAADPLFTALRNTTVLPTDRYTHVHLPGIYICAIFFLFSLHFTSSHYYYYCCSTSFLFPSYVSHVPLWSSNARSRPKDDTAIVKYTHTGTYTGPPRKNVRWRRRRAFCDSATGQTLCFFFRHIDARPCL